MKPSLRWAPGLALAGLLIAGCAGESSSAARISAMGGARPAVAAPPPPAVVLMYDPKTPSEEAAAEALELADEQARADMTKAEDELTQASIEFESARRRLNARELSPGATRPTQDDVKRLYDTAVAKKKRYDGLIRDQGDRYEEFFSEYPADWYERQRFADFLADNDFSYEAAAQCRKVIEMAPTYPYAYNTLGALYNHMGRDLEAVLLFRKAIDLKDDDAVFHDNLAVNYSVHRREVADEFGWDLPRVFRECILSYQRARALAPMDKDIAYDLATEYVLAKFFHVENFADEAIEAWKHYLSLDLSPTERAIAYRNLATTWLREKKDPVAAEAWVQKALALMPNEPSCRAVLEQCKAAEKQPTEAK